MGSLGDYWTRIDRDLDIRRAQRPHQDQRMIGGCTGVEHRLRLWRGIILCPEPNDYSSELARNRWHTRFRLNSGITS